MDLVGHTGDFGVRDHRRLRSGKVIPVEKRDLQAQICDLKVQVDETAKKLWRCSMMLRIIGEMVDEAHRELAYELGQLNRITDELHPGRIDSVQS